MPCPICHTVNNAPREPEWSNYLRWYQQVWLPSYPTTEAGPETFARAYRDLCQFVNQSPMGCVCAPPAPAHPSRPLTLAEYHRRFPGAYMPSQAEYDALCCRNQDAEDRFQQHCRALREQKARETREAIEREAEAVRTRQQETPPSADATERDEPAGSNEEPDDLRPQPDRRDDSSSQSPDRPAQMNSDGEEFRDEGASQPETDACAGSDKEEGLSRPDAAPDEKADDRDEVVDEPQDAKRAAPSGSSDKASSSSATFGVNDKQERVSKQDIENARIHHEKLVKAHRKQLQRDFGKRLNEKTRGLRSDGADVASQDINQRLDADPLAFFRTFGGCFVAFTGIGMIGGGGITKDSQQQGAGMSVGALLGALAGLSLCGKKEIYKQSGEDE